MRFSSQLTLRAWDVAENGCANAGAPNGSSARTAAITAINSPFMGRQSTYIDLGPSKPAALEGQP